MALLPTVVHCGRATLATIQDTSEHSAIMYVKLMRYSIHAPLCQFFVSKPDVAVRQSGRSCAGVTLISRVKILSHDQSLSTVFQIV